MSTEDLGYPFDLDSDEELAKRFRNIHQAWHAAKDEMVKRGWSVGVDSRTKKLSIKKEIRL